MYDACCKWNSCVVAASTSMLGLLRAHPVREGNWKLPGPAARQMINASFLMGSLLKQVSEHYSALDVKVFNFVPKAHMLLHVALLSQHLHPCITWCFAGEDMMRRTQMLVRACVRGNKPAGVIAKATRHYALGMHLRWLSASEAADL